MREIVLDTETTGMSPEDGHRLVEIGCVELENHIPTGRHLQLYINPERPVPPEATSVHGLTDSFLADKPVFSQVYSDLLEFIGDSRLVIHNAEFDMKFINRELQTVGHPPIPWPRVVDTLTMARRKFPGSPANLDALCRRFGIDNTARTFHGALLDSELLAEVYLELLGGRQHGLGLAASPSKAADVIQGGPALSSAPRAPRPHEPTPAEQALHDALLEKMGKTLWKIASG
ncbi:MAG: DNA polymerase III subunit epsilon [Alphaproteobacteria bacterium]|nr:DNA polymerase III subunit epsilon [Alphaproteobacteria bacterium]